MLCYRFTCEASHSDRADH
uniref:Uncharacterized protein n=1 Tax=Anguilla anguilla TaxID=7936 RepID=A0A0E9TYQ5_ANGAN